MVLKIISLKGSLISGNLSSAKWFRAVLPAFLAVSFCFFNLWLIRYSPGFGALDIDFGRSRLGSFLLAGLPTGDIVRNMPLFETLFSLALNLEINTNLLYLGPALAIYTLAFCAGCLLRGYWAGILSLLAAGLADSVLVFSYDLEQAVYSVLLMLVLCFMLLLRGERTLKNSIYCGLAIGASMLVRTPLFLFPPVVVFSDWLYSSHRSRAFILRSVAVLIFSYLLLLPWGFLNYSVTGKFNLFDSQRAADNIITSAKGTVYASHGDSRRLAGISENDSAFLFFVREVAKDPLFYALASLRRLLGIFLFHPWLFGFFLAALAVNREKQRLFVFGLPVYFILVHSLLSIAVRYFHPVFYLSAPLLAAAFMPGRFAGPAGECGAVRKAVGTVFLLALGAVLAVEAVVLAYPQRLKTNTFGSQAYAREMRRFSNDRFFGEIRCRELWQAGDDADFYECLDAYSRKFDHKVYRYFLSALASGAPASLPLPSGSEQMKPHIPMDCRIIQMLRELELGAPAAAAISFRDAYALYESGGNAMVLEAPYRKDKEIAMQLRQDSDSFWLNYAYNMLVLWPPERIAKILTALDKNSGIPGGIKLLERVAGEVLAGGEFRGRRMNEAAMRKTVLSPAGLKRFRRITAAGKEIQVQADAGTPRFPALAAADSLFKVRQAVRQTPAALMKLCSGPDAAKDAEQALQACRGVVYAVETAPGRKTAELENLRSDASLASCRLLGSLGRTEESAAALAWTIESASAAWPGLSAAKKALAKTGAGR